MAAAFQADAFQADAFQVTAVIVEVPIQVSGPPIPRRVVNVVLSGELFIVRCSILPGQALSPVSLVAGKAHGSAVANNARLESAAFVMLTGKAAGEHYISEEELLLIAQAA
jgi:hypothetical protein